MKASFTGMRSTARFTAEIDDEDQEAGTGVVSYDWDWGDGTTHGTQKSPKHTYTKSGSYQWKVTVSIRYLEQTVSRTESGRIDVTPAGIKLLRVKQSHVNKKARTVTIKLRSQINGDGPAQPEGRQVCDQAA